MFTSRENEIIQLIAQGLSSRVIADRLCVSIEIVKSHRSKRMRHVFYISKNYKVLSMKHLSMIKALLIPAALILSTAHASAQATQNKEMIIPRTQAKLPEGHIYLPHEQLTIAKDTSNGQLRIHLEISNSHTREREIQVFLKPESEDLQSLTTGTYELFFTGTALTLTNRTTGEKIVFEIGRPAPDSASHVRQVNVDKRINAIGIATYFKTCPRH